MKAMLVNLLGVAAVIGILAMFYYADKQDKADAHNGVVTSENTVMAVVVLAVLAFAAIAYFLGLPQ
jgi:hypothetical protein